MSIFVTLGFVSDLTYCTQNLITREKKKKEKVTIPFQRHLEM
jgi:hypothetical protein